MTPHFCLPALRHSSPAGTSRPHRGENPHFPGTPAQPPPRAPPAGTELPPHPAPPAPRPGLGPSSRPCQGQRGSISRGEHGAADPRRSLSTAEEWGEERKSSSALLPEESPPPTPPAPVRSAAAVAAGLQPGGIAPSPSPHHPAPASPLTSVPAHAQARPGARPPPDIAVAEGRGGARRGGHCPPPGGRRRLTCPLRLPALRRT